MRSQQQQLLSCPFCGGPAHSRYTVAEGHSAWVAGCDKCEGNVTSIDNDNRCRMAPAVLQHLAETQWNRRATADV